MFTRSINALLVLSLALTSAATAQVVPDPNRFLTPPRLVDLQGQIPTPGQPHALVTVPGATPESEPLTLELFLSSVRAPGCKAFADRGSNDLVEVDLPPPGTFKGQVHGQPNSVVAASVVAGNLRLLIDLDTTSSLDPIIAVQHATELGLANAQNQYALYTSTDLRPGPWTCGTDHTHHHPDPNPDSTPTGDYTPRACARIAQIAIDADHEFFLANASSVVTSIADIESVMIANDVIYMRDVEIGHQATAFIIRTSENDPYTTADAGGLLDQFRIHWDGNHGDILRDVAHLFTGRDINGNIIGVAYLTVICNTAYAYGYSQSRFTADIVGRTGLTAHELGHNWSAGHCDGEADCSIMCSGIGGCAGNLNNFSINTIATIAAHRNSRPCLYTSRPLAYDDAAYTLKNQPIRIDVLANDSDAGCTPLTTFSFPAFSFAGQRLTRSVGTGPNGRDEILYTPSSTYSGEDAFIYTVRNSGNFFAEARANISVVAPRPADSPALAVPGINATYYHTFPLSITDIPLGTQLSTLVVPTIDFPSSTNPIAGGPKATGVGIIATGTLNIPTAGTYTFFTESDDGSALYLNNGLLIANDGPQGMFEIGVPISLPAGPVAIRYEYFQGGGAGGLLMKIQGPGFAKQVVPANLWEAPGVTLTFYDLGSALSDLPNFASLTPAHSDIIPNIDSPDLANFLATSARSNDVAAQFTGYLSVPTTGFYRLFTESDDASILVIDGAEVVSNRGAHGAIEQSGAIALSQGLHAFRIEYWQGGGGGRLIARIEGPGLPKQVIPPSMLFRAAPDCNQDGINDTEQLIQTLNLGDIALGGNGFGTSNFGAGLNPTSGVRVEPTGPGAGRASGGPLFRALDGINGRPLYPMVNGVFLPNRLSQIAVGFPSFQFSPTSGAAYDAIRSDAALLDAGAPQPIILADKPGVARKGLGMHANSGITFNLNQIRAAHPGRTILTVSGSAGLTRDGCINRDASGEIFVLLDGQAAYRSILTDSAPARHFEIPITSTHQYLSFAILDASATNCDHFVIADAQLTISSAADSNGDGILDACQCIADFNQDGGVDGQDIEAFFIDWEAGLTSADVNQDGGIDGQDIEFFFIRWEAGGC